MDRLSQVNKTLVQFDYKLVLLCWLLICMVYYGFFGKKYSGKFKFWRASSHLKRLIFQVARGLLNKFTTSAPWALELGHSIRKCTFSLFFSVIFLVSMIVIGIGGGELFSVRHIYYYIFIGDLWYLEFFFC